jgi:hypothetical protein
MTTTYQGWWAVPDHLLPVTALGELEYPRTADGQPVAAWVDTRDWSDRETSIPLYDVRACPPTKATARQLDAAAARSGRQRRCADCGACCQRPLPSLDADDPRPLCPACRHLALLRRRQAELAADRLVCTQRARELLAWTGAAVIQVDLTIPPPTPAGRRRPPTAARVRAVDLDGTRLVDVPVRLVGRRARHVPDGAVAPQEVAPAIDQALGGRRLPMWNADEATHLRLAARHQDLPGPIEVAWSLGGVRAGPQPPIQARAAAIRHLATQWRGQLHPHTRTLVECLPPGTPDRLLLMLRRIATTTTAAQQRPGVDPGGVATPTPTPHEATP